MCSMLNSLIHYIHASINVLAIYMQLSCLHIVHTVLGSDITVKYEVADGIFTVQCMTNMCRTILLIHY